MLFAPIDLARTLAATEPGCTAPGVSMCALGGTSVGVIIATLVGGGWLLSEALGALRARRLRRIADGSDTPL